MAKLKKYKLKNGIIFYCPECKKSTDDENVIVIANKTEQRFTCSGCGRVFRVLFVVWETVEKELLAEVRKFTTKLGSAKAELKGDK